VARAAQGDNAILRATAILDNPRLAVVLAVWSECFSGFRDRLEGEAEDLDSAWDCAMPDYDKVAAATGLGYERAVHMVAQIRGTGIAFPDGVVIEEALRACRTIALRRLQVKA
jgi:hypothetical protein